MPSTPSNQAPKPLLTPEEILPFCDEKMKMTAITATVGAADSTIFVVRLMIHLR